MHRVWLYLLRVVMGLKARFQLAWYKNCIDSPITPTAPILVNRSLSECSFPSHLKSAHVSPLLKKSTLGKENMKKYRPVSNLHLTFKVVRKAVKKRLNSHISGFNTSIPYQSACKKFRSTETAFLKIHNDILSSMNDGKVTELFFDTMIPRHHGPFYCCEQNGRLVPGDGGGN